MVLCPGPTVELLYCTYRISEDNEEPRVGIDENNSEDNDISAEKMMDQEDDDEMSSGPANINSRTMPSASILLPINELKKTLEGNICCPQCNKKMYLCLIRKNVLALLVRSVCIVSIANHAPIQ